MSKCVKDKKTGVIIRVPKGQAKKLVDAGTHVYIDKKSYKMQEEI